MEKTYRIQFSEGVQNEDLESLDKPIKERIVRDVVRKLTVNPVAFSKPLSGSLKNFRSMRSGAYRVIFSVEKEIITVQVIAIGHRQDIYGLAQKRLSG